MAETSINMVDALRGQQDQLRRLIAQKGLIGGAPKGTLSEMQAQVTELKRLLAELENVIQGQLQRDDT
jgi:Mg2+ and Co2+ transporter CorA